jgi:2-keto-3-deoxy-L-rhamnonate aldolase RhmA
MHGNRVKEQLRSGGVAHVVSGHSISSDTIDFCGQLGFHGFWIEGEHGPVAWHQIGDLSRACDLWNMASVMRIYSHDPGVITRVLDLGVNGIVVPHVNSKAEAEGLVRATRFSPLGLRGMFQGRRSYGDPNFLQQANDEILLVVLIEEWRAVERLDEILTVDHIDVFFVAPSDLAQTMGYFGQPDHPAVQEVVEKSLAKISAAGRVAGALGAEKTMPRYRDLGVRFFLTSFDPWIKAGAREYLAKAAATEKR